jgi:oligopeptide transport system substrate-binding protein
MEPSPNRVISRPTAPEALSILDMIRHVPRRPARFGTTADRNQGGTHPSREVLELRTHRFTIGGIGLAVLGLLTAAACGSTSSSGSKSGTLASTQVLNFPVFSDPGSWDPGEDVAETDSELMENVFDNLWRFNDSLQIVPDIALSVPTVANGGISADGLTYTVKLNPAAKFSNGDPVTSKDVLYSWNRATALQGGYAYTMSAIQGFSAVQAAAGAPTASFQGNIETQLAAGNSAFQMSGLTAPDPETVQIKLSEPCGWCLSAWSLQSVVGAIVDENAIKTNPVNWWQSPSTLIGTGAYKLTSYIPKEKIVFTKVANWWGNPKPTINTVNIDIKDPSTAPTTVDAFFQHNYDIVGYGGFSANIPLANILAIKANSNEKQDLLTQPKGRTTWLSFNVGYPAAGGPFLGETAQAKGLRMAFDLAVDKTGLATTVCHNLICAAATGGLITTGLVGNGGANSDPLAKFDPGTAKQLLKQYDPTGKLTANLTYSYDSNSLNQDTAEYLQNAWQTNLGVHVNLNAVSDHSIFIKQRLGGQYMMSRDGWQFDYNHPQDWYDNLWGAAATAEDNNTSGFDDPTYDSVLKQADQEPISQALSLYNQLSGILQTDVVYIPLYYTVGNFLIQPYVSGAGSNTAFDHYWDEIKILSH